MHASISDIFVREQILFTLAEATGNEHWSWVGMTFSNFVFYIPNKFLSDICEISWPTWSFIERLNTLYSHVLKFKCA